MHHFSCAKSAGIYGPGLTSYKLHVLLDLCVSIHFSMARQTECGWPQEGVLTKFNLGLQATKVALVDGLRSNSSMAAALCAGHVLTGSWRNILSDLHVVEQLTSTDVQQCAAHTFTEDNMFTGHILAA